MKGPGLILTIIIILGIVFLFDHDNARDPGPPSTVPAKIINYDNGVYYFPQNEDAFGYALSEFIKNHPELRVIAISGNGTGGYGYDQGYFVCFERRQ